MNYIYFNEKGRLKKSTIEDLYAGSINNDTIYIFADFDKDGPIEYEVSLMFERSDGFKVGPVEAMIDNQISPLTNELVRCYSFLMGGDILAVAGPLQITARYHSTYIDPELEITEEAIKATSMVIANVNQTVSLGTGSSTLLLNLNRKIVNLDEKVNNHITDFINHNHNDLYYVKDEVELNFGKELDSTGYGNIKLLGGQGNTLSSVPIQTNIMIQPPGSLLHSGLGRYIIQKNKNYLVGTFGESSVEFKIYLKRERPLEGMWYELVETFVGSISNGSVIKLLELTANLHQGNPDIYDFSITIESNGIVEEKTISAIYVGILDNRYDSFVMGISSAGYYVAYEV